MSKFKSALSVNEGIEQPPSVNQDSVLQFIKNTKKKLSVQQYVDGIVSGNRTILSQAITIIESSLNSHSKLAGEIIDKCLPFSGNSLRIGITGVPGVGKSSFIEAFGLHLASKGKKIAVLAVDPSSERSKGSILGDKTRMELLSVNDMAFIRPSPAAGSLGGVARKTHESIILCEAAGFDIIIIETVGVGQSETAVHSMVDFFLLLMLAGAGDELQGIKRGIMEMADIIAITKSDGNNLMKAELAAGQYRNALHLFPASQSKWIPKVLLCSSVTNFGIDNIWNTILEYLQLTKENNYFSLNRSEQAKYFMYETINQALHDNFYKNKLVEDDLHEMEKQVLNGKLTPFVAAKHLLDKYYQHK
jgi:LAO/AO transport system kinase